MIVNDFELANVAVLHHDRQELDDHLRAGSEQHLTLSALLGIVDALQGIGQNIHTNHDCGTERIQINFKCQEFVFCFWGYVVKQHFQFRTMQNDPQGAMT